MATMSAHNQPVRMALFWRRPAFWIMLLVASQYAFLQLLTGAEYFDAPRNLQWGTFLFEQPRYLFDAENVYDRVNGFPPTPRSLAPAGLANGRSGPLHPWWGPTYLGLFALVWGLTGSFTALQLVVPLAAGATVLLTYLFGVRFLDQRTGLIGALVLAFFPNFREMSTIAMVEPLSALLLLGAAWALLARRAWIAALYGTLAALGKVDMIAIYLGLAAGVMLLTCWQEHVERRLTRATLWAAAIVLFVPLLVIGPWLFVIYGVVGRPATVEGGPNLATFQAVLPLMSDQVFTLGRPLTLLGLVVLFGLVIRGIAHARRAYPGMLVWVLAFWVGLGVLVLLGYAALPGSSNNPRVFIPTLPAFALLVALGLRAIGPRMRLASAALLLMLFLLGNTAGVLYQLVEGRRAQALQPVWKVLRAAPAGAVLSEHYWGVALYTRQVATWFEHDPVFQEQILFHPDRLRAYLAQAPIRYIVLPVDESEYALLQRDSLAQLYLALPFGRALELDDAPLVAPETRRYLDQTYPQQVLGGYVVYTLNR
jgi:hypothetical protein